MEFIDLTVGDCHYRIEFERRIAIITGDSGRGKTELVDNIGVSAPGVIFSSSRPVLVAGDGWQFVIKEATESIIIFDDMDAVTTGEFSRLVKQTNANGNFFVLICRDDLKNFKFDQLSISVSEMYRWVCSEDGHEHYTERMYKEDSNKRGIIPDAVLIEDSTGGLTWFKEFFRNTDIIVSSIGGKGAVNKGIDKLLKGCAMKKIACNNILVIVDLSAFGAYMRGFVDQCKLLSERCSQVEVFYLDCYECFEEFLLRTNLVSKIDNTSCNDLTLLNKNVSWEKSYFSILQGVTKGQPFSYKEKGTLSECYTTDCGICKSSCKFKMSGNKQKALILNSKYDFLLDLLP